MTTEVDQHHWDEAKAIVLEFGDRARAEVMRLTFPSVQQNDVVGMDHWGAVSRCVFLLTETGGRH